MCGDDDHEGYSCMKYDSVCTMGTAQFQMLEPSKMGKRGAWLHKEVMEVKGEGKMYYRSTHIW